MSHTEDSSSSLTNSSENKLEQVIVGASAEKLAVVAESLKEWLQDENCTIVCRPCDDLAGYRCKCSFQIVVVSSTSSSQDNGQVVLSYAVRQAQVPVVIQDFPPANYRIAMAMQGLLEALNNNKALFASVRQGLASATFSSSWCGTLTTECTTDIAQKADCLLTLIYDQSIENSNNSWEDEARLLCQKLQLVQITGRSKKRVLCAWPSDLAAGTKKRVVLLRDTVCLIPPNNVGSSSTDWKVQLRSPPPEKAIIEIPVYYEKPEGAFYHPNARAMSCALEWMLERISFIVRNSPPAHPRRMLELYCGCGAHTVALAKSGLLQSIDAVEIDRRLVAACRENCRLNQVDDIVRVYSSDAGAWTRALQKKTKHRKQSGADYEYDILLVDPPRQGLGDDVCDMLLNQDFIEHFLYISCGRDALVRDLERLSTQFKVVSCTLLDLFPGTYSVESLVHLHRRQAES